MGLQEREVTCGVTTMESQLKRNVSGDKTEEASVSASFPSPVVEFPARAITKTRTVFPFKYNNGSVLLFTAMPRTDCCCCCCCWGCDGDLDERSMERSRPATILTKGRRISATRTTSIGANLMSTSDTNRFARSSGLTRWSAFSGSVLSRVR